MYESIEDLYKVIRRKTRESRKIDWELCTGIYRLSAIVHSNLASSLSLYLRMYICTLSKSLVYESPHFAQFPLCTRQQYLVSHRRARSNLWDKLYSISWHLARLAILGLCNEGTWTDTCLTRHFGGVACETLRSEPRFHSVPGCRIDTKSKKNVFTRTSGCQKRHRIVLMFLLYKQ